MQFEVKEVQTVPPNDRPCVYGESKYLPIVEKCMASKSGVVAAEFPTVKDAQRAEVAVSGYLRQHGLRDLFRIQLRRTMLFVTDLTRKGTDRDPDKSHV